MSKEYSIEELVDNLQKRELKKGITQYSDYVETELQGNLSILL